MVCKIKEPKISIIMAIFKLLVLAYMLTTCTLYSNNIEINH